MLNIFTLGSDKSLIGAPSLGDAVDRHRVYGESVDHLDIVIYTHQGENFKDFQISATVLGHPSNSRSKLFFARDASRIFKQVNKLHPVNIVVCQDPFVFGLVGVYLKWRYKIKLQINFHGDFWDNQAWIKERWYNFIFVWLSYFTVRQADAVRVVSGGIAAKLQQRGIDATRIHVISAPVQRPPVDQLQPEGVDYQSDKKYLLFVGRLVAAKNLMFMLKVFKQVHESKAELRLWLIGDGEERPKLERLIQEYGLSEAVFLLGQRPFERTGWFYEHAAALLLLSTNESFGKVIVEAGLLGCPTIASATTGAKAIIEPEKTGLVVPINDLAQSVRAVERILADDNLRQSLGRLAVENYKQRFERSSTIHAIINLWKGLASHE